MMRQIAGAFAEYEKARLVGKLKAARARKRKESGKCEGRLTRLERLGRDLKNEDDPEKRKALEARKLALGEAVRIAKRLHRASPKTGERRSLRKIAAELAALGHLNERGKPYSAKSVRAMLLKP